MSHFIGIVFGYGYAEILERYYEGNEVEPYLIYTREEAIIQAKKDIQSLIEYYEKEIQEGNNVDLYTSKIEEFKKFTDEDYFKYTAEGYIIKEGDVYSCYNPESKWDWYNDAGGRWGDYLPLLNGDRASQAYSCEIDWDEIKTPFCFVDEEGEWHEVGEMGWWGITHNEKERDAWESEFREYINTIKHSDILVTAVDFHI